MSSSRSTAIAAIAVTHDSAHVLPGWIGALEASGERERIELCVVDSGSSSAQLATMREQAGGRVDAFVALPNVGYGAACNAGAGATEAPALLFTNPDAQILSLPPRALAGPGLGATLLGAFATEPRRPLGFARLPGWREEARDLALGRWAGAHERSAADPAWVSGAALMIDREAFDRIGGFSPAFFMYFEDADLCVRHRCAGGSVELDDEFVIRHGSGKSTERVGSLAVELDAVNRLSGRRFAARYGAPWQQPALYLLLALAYVPRRLLAGFARRRLSLRGALDYAACMLLPRRALRRLA